MSVSTPSDKSVKTDRAMEKVKSILVSADVSLTSVVSTVVHHRKRTVRSPASVHPLALSQA